jgi:hypothetical protein
MTKLDIFNLPVSSPQVAPIGARWVEDNLEASPRRAKAWTWAAEVSKHDIAALSAAKVATFNERFNEALDNMIVFAVEQGLDLAVSDWIHDDLNKTLRREFALLQPTGEIDLPFGGPVMIYHTSNGWPDGRDPRTATTAPGR